MRAEARADITAEQAATVAPVIQYNDSLGTRTLMNGAKVGTKEVLNVYMDSGLPVYSDPPKNKKVCEYTRDDMRLASELLTEQYDRYWVLDMAAVVRDVKNGVPVHGFSTTSNTKTVGRR